MRDEYIWIDRSKTICPTAPINGKHVELRKSHDPAADYQAPLNQVSGQLGKLARAAKKALARRGDGATFLCARIDEIIDDGLKALAADFVDARVALQQRGILKIGEPFDIPKPDADAAILSIATGICLAASRAVAENADADARERFESAIRDCEAAWCQKLALLQEDDGR
jgi:hypothetical protein